jgi:hypothetical protein
VCVSHLANRRVPPFMAIHTNIRPCLINC